MASSESHTEASQLASGSYFLWKPQPIQALRVYKWLALASSHYEGSNREDINLFRVYFITRLLKSPMGILVPGSGITSWFNQSALVDQFLGQEFS